MELSRSTPLIPTVIHAPVLIAEFRGSPLAVAANAMVDQDITKMEFLNGLIVLSLVMDEKGTYKTGKIISGN